MTNSERVLESIEAFPEGICDKCLGVTTGIKPHQQIVGICHRLSARGLISREPGICTRGSEKARALNLLVHRKVPLARVGSSPLDDVDVFHRELIKALRRLDLSATRGEGFSAQVTRLREERRLPPNVANLMLAYGGFRNLVHHEAYELTVGETQIVQLLQRELRAWLQNAALSDALR